MKSVSSLCFVHRSPSLVEMVPVFHHTGPHQFHTSIYLTMSLSQTLLSRALTSIWFPTKLVPRVPLLLVPPSLSQGVGLVYTDHTLRGPNFTHCLLGPANFSWDCFNWCLQSRSHFKSYYPDLLYRPEE